MEYNKEQVLKPRRLPCKEMFFSGLLNNIKEKHIRPYMRYILKMINAIMNEDEEYNKVRQKELLEEL